MNEYKTKIEDKMETCTFRDVCEKGCINNGYKQCNDYELLDILDIPESDENTNESDETIEGLNELENISIVYVSELGV